MHHRPLCPSAGADRTRDEPRGAVRGHRARRRRQRRRERLMRPTTLIDQFAAALVGPPALSDSARRAVRLHTLDAIGAWIAGSTTDEGTALRRFGASALGGPAAERVAIHSGGPRPSAVDPTPPAPIRNPGAAPH